MANSLTQAAVTGTFNSSNPFSDKDLLQNLGIRGMQRLAGFIPLKSDDELSEAAPIDDKPLCSARTVKQFLWLIEQNFHGLRAMWLQKFTETEQRLPDEYLPTLMDKHRSRFGIPYYIHANVGKRAMWLADLPDNNPWRWFSQSRVNDAKPTRFGPRFGRHAEYRELRYENPQEAQAWLDKNWRLLATNDRLNILNMIRANLGQDDLPFLQKQAESLNELQAGEILQEIWYMLSLIAPELIEDTVQEIIDFVHLDFIGKHQAPVLDLRWSNVFLGNPQHVEQGIIRRLAAKELWWETLTQLIRLVPLNKWLEKWDSDVETLLSGARHGLQADLFIPVWIQRAIDESHEIFALGILRHQKPQINRFGWHVSHQSKLLERLSFENIQILLEETWMNPEKEISWQMP